MINDVIYFVLQGKTGIISRNKSLDEYLYEVFGYSLLIKRNNFEDKV